MSEGRLKEEMIEEVLEKRGTEIEAMNILAQLLQTGVDRRILAVVLELLEAGVSAESIADGKMI